MEGCQEDGKSRDVTRESSVDTNGGELFQTNCRQRVLHVLIDAAIDEEVGMGHVDMTGKTSNSVPVQT